MAENPQKTMLFCGWIVHIFALHVPVFASVAVLGQGSAENLTITRNAEIVSVNRSLVRQITTSQEMASIASSVSVQTVPIAPTQTTGLKDRPTFPASETQSSFTSILVTEGVRSISKVEASSTAKIRKKSRAVLSSTSATQVLPKAIIVTPTNLVVTTQTDTAVKTSVEPTRAISSSTAMQSIPTPFALTTKTSVSTMKQSSTSEPHSIAATLKPRHTTANILTNTPPEVKEPMKPIKLTKGKIFMLRIPEETFHDKEDGGVRHLELQLLTNESKPMPPTSWILLNQTSQDIFALPMETNKALHNFIVSATDSGNLTTAETLQVTINEDLNRYNHEISLKLELDNGNFLDHLSIRIMLLQKLAKFFAVNLTNIRVKSFGPGSSLTFHFGSVPFELCDHELLIQLKSTFTDSDKGVSPSFRKIILPQFSVISGHFKMLGPCVKDGDQTSAQSSPTNEDVWWLYACIPAILLIGILVTSGFYATRRKCARNKREIPEEEHRLNVDETQL